MRHMKYFGWTVLCPVAALTASCGGVSSSDDRELSQYVNAHPPVSEATWQSTGTLECRPASVDSCGPDGCERSETPATSVRWTPATRTYQRCDRTGCSSYPAQVSYSGSWANIALPANGVIMRLTGRNAFTEVVTQMDAVMVYRGQCR